MKNKNYNLFSFEICAICNDLSISFADNYLSLSYTQQLYITKGWNCMLFPRVVCFSPSVILTYFKMQSQALQDVNIGVSE